MKLNEKIKGFLDQLCQKQLHLSFDQTYQMIEQMEKEKQMKKQLVEKK